ncbi:hypothetical protein SELMODRAFT_417072 [Selaginella moellendorffii]|uniref:Uncharacterized protein n=1 Tax=Selaginella moellendorffii TaxID=88036 RepID=D8S199_SELML|nr:hypothetical protein SELMODRAFT_417072 [Selaginella moellendorffii]
MGIRVCLEDVGEKVEGKVWVVAVKSELKALHWVLAENRLQAKDTIYLVCIGRPQDPWVMNTFTRAKELCQNAKKELQLTIHCTARYFGDNPVQMLLESEAKGVGADYLVSARSRPWDGEGCFEFLKPVSQLENYEKYDEIRVKAKPRVKALQPQLPKGSQSPKGWF